MREDQDEPVASNTKRAVIDRPGHRSAWTRKGITAALASAAALGLLSACSTASVTPVSSARSATAPPPPASSAPAPTVTHTRIIIRRRNAPAVTQPGPPAADPDVTDPWAVVSAYYGDIESGNYPQAWALLSSGAVTGQTYQQFVNGFACTGTQTLTELGEAGDQVSFDLAAADTCTGVVQHYTGTDTVANGLIVSADVVQTGG
ncbi:MAG: hypothetical protein ACLP52_22275 [Streptosporangiaceae bacterium]